MTELDRESVALHAELHGKLEVRSKVRVVNEEMKVAAAEALAGYVIEPTPERILPDPLDKQVALRIGRAVAGAARESGVCR